MGFQLIHVIELVRVCLHKSQSKIVFCLAHTTLLSKTDKLTTVILNKQFDCFLQFLFPSCFKAFQFPRKCIHYF